ncbi:MAG: PRC-barrel domain-containing protein [Candidatus Thorarchaeota archaeon]|jgi:sporulation protein YlmC with PRC-barrel domain
MEIARSFCSKELKKADVVDSAGKTVGHIGDLTFTFDGVLKLKQFILSGPAWEEFLEAIKLKPDRDPVFDATLIKKMGDKVHLNTSSNSLKTTLDKDAISDDEIRLSKLTKLDILDKNGVKIGRANDVDFDVDGSVSIIVGGGFFEEKLEAIGLKSDIDLIVPCDVIASISDTIQLKVSKDELGTTMEKVREHIKAREDIETRREVSKVRLFSHRPF